MNVKPKNRIIIGYCRVSSHKQKDDLERQIEIIDNTEESEQQELVEDLVQIITFFPDNMPFVSNTSHCTTFPLDINGLIMTP